MKEYDLIIFMGQSNMAGRGITSKVWPEAAPKCIDGAGYEFRAISDPTKLYNIEEPFGVNENNPEGIYEPGKKTGSMVTSFVNAYFEASGVPVIAVSASKGGSRIEFWQDDSDYLTDAVGRFVSAIRYCENHNIKLRHKYMVWCQGESDGDAGTKREVYRKRFLKMLDTMRGYGVERCFLIAIGEYNGSGDTDYAPIRAEQLDIAEKVPSVSLVSNDFYRMKERGLMKDSFHYYQKAYNEVGGIAGKNAAASLE